MVCDGDMNTALYIDLNLGSCLGEITDNETKHCKRVIKHISKTGNRTYY